MRSGAAPSRPHASTAQPSHAAAEAGASATLPSSYAASECHVVTNSVAGSPRCVALWLTVCDVACARAARSSLPPDHSKLGLMSVRASA